MSNQPELVSAKTAMSMLDIKHRATFARFVEANPTIQCRLGGLQRPKYRRRQIELLLQENVR